MLPFYLGILQIKIGMHIHTRDVIDTIAIFDIDGVLVDPSRRLNLAKQSKNFWSTFLREDLLSLDEPREIGVKLLLRKAREGTKIVLVTGRPERLRRATLDQLGKIGIGKKLIDMLLMRKNNDRRPGWIVKVDLIRENLSGYRNKVVEIHDDEERILRELGILFPNARLYLHKEKRYVELREITDFL